jgi:AbrB family looped-hinge helix DNA binding protein
MLILTSCKEATEMAEGVLTSKGQVTIPKEIRERLGLGQGDRLDFVVEADGSVRIRPLARSPADLYGLLERPDQAPVTIEDMEAALLEDVADEAARQR